MKVRRCPKCHKLPIRYQEQWSGFAIDFGVDGNGEIEKEGILCEGEPYGVSAFCACGHVWTLRGVQQITELHKD